MKKFIPLTVASMCALSSMAQTIMFDDFNYASSSDANLSFNKWSVITGVSGPPEGKIYSKNNIVFNTDPNLSTNKIMEISSVVNLITHDTIHARIETQGFEYFEGTYAARVYFDESPFTNKDANIQTFYTIVDSKLSGDGTKYSEMDFEYMASDQWGTSTNKQVLYMTSWNRYIAEPWQAWKAYFAPVKSYQGWHTLVMSATDKKNVKFWVDGIYIGAKSITDNDGTSVYPRSNMQVAFANWIWNNKLGTGTNNRTSTFKVDWTLFYKDVEKTTTEINTLVNDFRTNGIQRRNLLGKVFPNNVTGIESENLNQNQIKVYPNKVHENEAIHIYNNYASAEFYVSDLLGNKIVENQTIGKEHSIFLKKGIYIITIYSENNIKTEKLIVE